MRGNLAWGGSCGPCGCDKHFKKGGARPDSLFGAARLRVPSSAGTEGPMGPVGRNRPGWRDARNLRPLGRRGCQSSQEARNSNKLPVETLTFSLEINKTDLSTASISSSYNYVKTLDLFRNSTDC